MRIHLLRTIRQLSRPVIQSSVHVCVCVCLEKRKCRIFRAATSYMDESKYARTHTRIPYAGLIVRRQK